MKVSSNIHRQLFPRSAGDDPYKTMISWLISVFLMKILFKKIIKVSLSWLPWIIHVWLRWCRQLVRRITLRLSCCRHRHRWPPSFPWCRWWLGLRDWRLRLFASWRRRIRFWREFLSYRYRISCSLTSVTSRYCWAAKEKRYLSCS